MLANQCMQAPYVIQSLVTQMVVILLLMSRNKKAEERARIQQAYGCSREHTLPTPQRPNIQQILNKKLDLQNQRLATLQDMPKTKQQMKRDDGEGVQEGGRARLRTFLQSNQQLLSSWKEEQRKQKQKFKSRLKLAALSPLKSQSKPKKLIKLPKQAKSLLSLRSTLRLGTNDRLQTVESQAYRYYLQRLVALMEQNREQLLQSRRKIKKELKKEKRLARQQAKEEILSSKRQLVQQIEQQLMQEDHINQQQALQRYRKQLQAQLEQELSQRNQEKPYFQSRVIMQSPRQEQEAIHVPPPPKEAIISNPQEQSLQRSRSAMVRAKTVGEIVGLSQREKERCARLIARHKHIPLDVSKISDSK